MVIGDRIKKLRKSLMLNQSDFAKELGIKQGYLSNLEQSKKVPSEQLILSICRTFGVRYEWLKEGRGKIYADLPYTAKGLELIKEINRRLEIPDRLVPLSTVAAVLGIDKDHIPNDLKLPEEFPGAIYILIEIFKEGDKRKIDAIMAQLHALDPRPKLKIPVDNQDNNKGIVKKKKAT